MYSIMERAEQSEEFKKFCTYKKITFFKTKGPNPHQLQNYLQDLKKNKVRLLVRANGDNREVPEFADLNIVVVDLHFKYRQIPGALFLETISALLRSFLADRQPVGVVIQGYSHSTFLLAYCLIELGIPRKRALDMVQADGSEVTFMQFDYLRQKGIEMEENRDRRSCAIL